ncbi:S28 family serine protease [Spirillospora sp. CA-294931]|uniref:S28 family serine protease n=1 Tax=Spirillospora sp. CA-294931 TaxID=3240042 RepID=UPI003D89EF88
MPNPMATALSLALTAGLTFFPTTARATDIADRLEAIPGLSVEEKNSSIAGLRWFSLSYRQPVDHRRPNQGWFNQRIMLQHRQDDRPVVLHSGGYTVRQDMFKTEPTELLDANQIALEQRFFAPSRPEPADWTKDTIWQTSSDAHRIVLALKKIYAGKWISTGSSKGGEAAVHLKRFYPQDVDGTVAYVAPNNIDDNDDRAYDRFLSQIGSPSTRAHVRALAKEFLRRRPAMLKRLKTEAAAKGWTFDLLGTPDRAFENAVMAFELFVWAGHLESDIKKLPSPNASTDTLYKTLNVPNSLGYYNDQTLRPYTALYYQSGTQLGWPSPNFAHLRPLLRHEQSFQPRSYVPRTIKMAPDKKAMRDIDHWVRTKGTRLMFVNGGNDPWTAEPFRLGPGTKDSAVHTAPGMNHVIDGRLISHLPPTEKTKAIATLHRWTS